jgi:hypothetical protein
VAYTAEENSTNFEKKPPKKGIPARERRKIDSATATNGIFRARPLKSSMRSPTCAEAADTARNAAPFWMACVRMWYRPPAIA